MVVYVLITFTFYVRVIGVTSLKGLEILIFKSRFEEYVGSLVKDLILNPGVFTKLEILCLVPSLL